jgi:glutathione synthase/RimK-type ligase-like ATP-grasp enzyme
MKKILILIASVPKSKRADNWQGFADEVRKDLNGEKFSLELWAISELSFLADGNNSKIWKRETGQDLKEFDLIVIRDAGKYKEFARSIAWYAKLNGTPIIDRVWQKSFSGSKLSYAFLRAVNEISSPATLSATSGIKLLNSYTKLKADSELSKETKLKLDFPLICKAIDARKGNLNFLVKNRKELKEVLSADYEKETFFILQEYIENDGDWRVLVIGGKVSLAIFRSGDKSKTHLNNSSKGAETKLKQAEEVPKSIAELAVRTAVKEKLSVAGVDIVQNKLNGEIFILESNPSPQLQSGAFVAEKIKAYAEGLVRIAEREDGKLKLGKNKRLEEARQIGRREWAGVLESGQVTRAKMDTGAYWSTLHVQEAKLKVKNGLNILEVIFDNSEVREFDKFRKINVAPTSGEVDSRFAVKLNLLLGGARVETDVTLTQRHGLRYKLLLGRRALRQGGFVVDPARSFYFGKSKEEVRIKLSESGK